MIKCKLFVSFSDFYRAPSPDIPEDDPSDDDDWLPKGRAKREYKGLYKIKEYRQPLLLREMSKSHLSKLLFSKLLMTLCKFTGAKLNKKRLESMTKEVAESEAQPESSPPTNEAGSRRKRCKQNSKFTCQ